MKDPISKLRSEQVHQSETQAQLTQGTQGREFATVEDLLREDAAQVAPPETILQRLKQSLTREIPPPSAWWKKWFGRR